MNDDFAFTTRYDKTSYQALADASWQMFRKPRMQSQTYPVLVVLALLVLISALFNRETLGTAIVIGGVVMAVLMLAAIPLSGISARAKMCRNAIKDARKKGPFPAQVHFAFGKDGIRATVNQQTDLMRYSQVSTLAVLGEWRFLFFGQAAYLFHRSDLQSREEGERLEQWLEEKCGHPFVQLKGEGPKER